MGRRSGVDVTFDLSYCTFAGANSSTAVNACLGEGLITCDHCDFSGWPSDWCACSLTASQAMTIRYTRIVIAATAASASGLHADGLQIGIAASGGTLDMHHTTITMPTTGPVGGVGVTGCLNLGSNTGDWAAPATVSDCIFKGGSYTLYFEDKAVVSASQSITIGPRVYVGNGEFGPVYPASAPGYNLSSIVIQGLGDATTGLPITFDINIGGVVYNDVLSCP